MAMLRSFVLLAGAAVAASLSAPRTCVVSDVAYGRVSGSLYKSFGGDLGAVHDVVAVAGTDEAGDDVFGLCAALHSSSQTFGNPNLSRSSVRSLGGGTQRPASQGQSPQTFRNSDFP